MTPPFANHSLLPGATRKKVHALPGRAEVRACDVFDLAMLIARAGGKPLGAGTDRKTQGKAAERALAISSDAHAAQVIAHLAPDDAAPYALRQAREARKGEVVGPEKVAR